MGFAGICKALLMVLFTVALLLLFYACDLSPPSPLEAGVVEELLQEGGGDEVPIGESFLSR